MGEQHRLRSHHRSFSADQCGEKIGYEKAGRPLLRFGLLACECRMVEQSIEMPLFDVAGDLESFIRHFDSIAHYCIQLTDDMVID